MLLFKVINDNRGAEKSLARPWKETSYSDQDLQHYTKTYGLQTAVVYVHWKVDLNSKFLKTDD